MLSYRIVDSKHYTGPLQMPAIRRTIYIISDRSNDLWWSYTHPRAPGAHLYFV